MDRWTLSRDHTVLTIVRQIVRRTGEVEGTLVYRKVGEPAPETAPPAPAPTAAPAPVEPARPEPIRREPPPEVAELIVPLPARAYRFPCAIRWTPSTPMKATTSISRP